MMQLNSKELKIFRDILAKWHIATLQIADNICICNSNINNLNKSIYTDIALIEKLANGEKIMGNKSVEDLESEISRFNEKIEQERKALAEYKKTQEESLKAGTNLVSEDLLNAIKDYLGNIYDATKEDKALKELVKWFSANGAKDADIESVKPYIRALGLKKNSAKGIAKSGNHNKVGSDKEVVTIFLGAICDEPNMKKALPEYKWITVFEKKANK